MLIQPILERELRGQARKRGTFWMRTAAASVAMLPFCGSALFRGDLSSQSRSGAWVLALLHTYFCLFLAVTCPLICGDTLARERRQGTLGILLLTPLRPSDVVLGKITVYLARTFSFWLATVPVLIVPFLIGGVSLVDIGFALGLELGVMLGGLSGGLIASALVEREGHALALSMVLTVVIGECFALLSFLALLPSFWWYPRSEYAQHWFLTATFGPWLIGTGLLYNGFSGILARLPRWMTPALWTALGAVLSAALATFGGAVVFAAWRVRRFGRGPGVTGGAPPLFGKSVWLRPWRRRSRSAVKLGPRHNPVYWLYTLRPASGLNRWAWCGVVTLVCGFLYLVKVDMRQIALVADWMLVLLLLALTFAAAASFRRELEEGAFEILMVTPLRPAKLISGRVLALWRDFGPGFFVCSGLAASFRLVGQGFGSGGASVWLFGAWLLVAWCGFLAIPAIGCRMAVRGLNPLVAFVWTAAVTWGLPGALIIAAAANLDRSDAPSYRLWFLAALFGIAPLVEAILCAWAAVTDLETRRYQLKPLQRR